MIIIGGPYIGNFEQEIISFRPYIRWLYDVLSYDKFYVNTHFNRLFLYDFLPEDNKIAVFKYLTRDEIGQRGYVHKMVKQKDYQLLIKHIKEYVAVKEDISKKDISFYSVNYVMSTPPNSIYNKRFSKIQTNLENDYTNYIVYIPANNESKENLLKVKKFLREYDNVVIIGDKQTRFKDENVVLKDIDYIENGWKRIVQIISDARVVICPVGFWTTVCNLQQVPVFSWGDQVGQHKPGGIYYFGNTKCLAFASDTMEIVLKMLEGFLEENCANI